MVHKYGRMGVCMRDLGRKGKHPEKEECYLLMVIIMWGIGQMINVIQYILIFKENGYGEYYHNDGSIYKGNWQNDLQEGDGVELLTDNSKYSG